MTTMTQATYGVRGLSCWRCMISAVDAVRALPGVHTVGMDLEPHGEVLQTAVVGVALHQHLPLVGKTGALLDEETGVGQRPPHDPGYRPSRQCR